MHRKSKASVADVHGKIDSELPGDFMHAPRVASECEICGDRIEG